MIPADFGVTREIAIGHRLTGWNAVRSRAHALGLALDDAAVQNITRIIKERADVQPMSLDEVDALLRESGGGAVNDDRLADFGLPAREGAHRSKGGVDDRIHLCRKSSGAGGRRRSGARRAMCSTCAPT